MRVPVGMRAGGGSVRGGTGRERREAARPRGARVTATRHKLVFATRSYFSALVLLGGWLGIWSLVSCSGGGSRDAGGGSTQAVFLTAIEFPDPSGQSGGDPQRPPQNASLVQQVRFVFSGGPDAGSVHSRSLKVTDEWGRPVDGVYAANGAVVTFTPRLPLGDVARSVESAGNSLHPGRTYFVEVFLGQTDSVRNLLDFSAELRERHAHPTRPADGVLISMITTTDPALFYSGLTVHPLQLSSLTPVDGTTAFAPFLYQDPDHKFSVNQPIELELNGPLFSATEYLDQFHLVDLDTQGATGGRELGVRAELVENTLTRSIIRLVPSGILPFGHLLAVEIPSPLRHLSAPPMVNETEEVVAVYRTESTADDTVWDRFVEEFESTENFDAEASRQPGIPVAEWDGLASGVIQAAAVFPGGGELGPFVPPQPAESATVILDTNSQPFPLLNGSTPLAPVGTVVEGGRFHFTDVVIPAGVTVRAVGSNPLVMTATGTIVIRGEIDVAGRDGTSDFTYDSAVFPIPGGRPGAGGGRGGAAHPSTYFPPGQFGLMNLISPPRGENGQAAAIQPLLRGGQGGESAILDSPDVPNPEISCGELNGNHDDSRGSFGGGGSFLTLGRSGVNGLGNVVPRFDGTWHDTWPETLRLGGSPGTSPFQDGDATNNFFGGTGELDVVFGGQGGGGGGSRAEGYHCGFRLPWGRDEFRGNFPDTTGDARGGGGGGGGGALILRALGSVRLESGTRLLADGGRAGGGEILGNSKWGGGGGGGSGGAVIIQSTTGIAVENNARIKVSGGNGRAGRGRGGDGIVQLQVPFGQTAQIGGSVVPRHSWVDSQNVKNPVSISPLSRAASRWIDVGRVIDRAPVGTNPIFVFHGTDANGRILTDAEGNVENAAQKPFRCGYLGQIDPLTQQYWPGEEPRQDWLPPNAEVVIEFQAGDAIRDGSREVDPDSFSAWSADPAVANGRQFIRYRVTFDLAANGEPIHPRTQRPVIQRFSLDFRF